MAKIPFKVSARTALLIGRENVATAKGALIELVKNCYDADSPVSLIHFDNNYSELFPTISSEYVEDIISKGISLDNILEVYEYRSNAYFFKEEDLNANNKEQFEKKKSVFKKLLNKLNAIYVLDFGEGMTKSIIENYWMTIGTDNKLSNIWTKNNRIKAGAKGIGRFALDRLGSSCEMITFYNPKDRELLAEEKDGLGYRWIVDWEDFEVPSKTIGDINAELQEIVNSSFVSEVYQNTDDRLSKLLVSFQNRQYGTLLKITNLRDFWTDDAVNQVFSDLEVLIPPKETEDFQVVVSSALHPSKYGEVLNSICDDFDYKLVAKADANQTVKITIYRREYDVESIPDVFFEREEMSSKEQFQKATFLKGRWEKETTFSALVAGFALVDAENHFRNIGPFEFSFYYLKRGYTSADATRFFYRKFFSNFRKDWLRKFGGIKLFRDNFRVRPYGETNDVAFDWLGLGSRKAASPAGVAKSEGGYRVEPENVAGAIKISRLTNLNFEDKSSREGLQENNTFKVFKLLIASIIKVLEEDRSYIARQLVAFDYDINGRQRELEEAEKLANKIIERARENKSNESESSAKEKPSEESSTNTALAHLIEAKNEKIERLEEEQKLLRGLASSGIVSAAFGHDLSKLSDNLENRVEKLLSLISDKINEDEYIDSEKRKNPFEQLRRMKNQDLKIRNWLNFSLGFTKKDKRKRKQLFLTRYFKEFKLDWTPAMEERAINLQIDTSAELELRVFEIDFDSIFSNLLVNSIDAFISSKLPDKREIFINCCGTINEIIIDYRDTGPGLNKDIENPETIFQPLFTTKLSSSGDEIGTGLGMWIVKSVVEENDGAIKLLYPEKGFGLRITFPIKYKAV